MAAGEQVAKQLDGRSGRPVQIVEDEHDRARRRRVGEPQGDGLVQPVALAVGVGLQGLVQPVHLLHELGDEPAQVAAEAPERRRLDVVDVVAERLGERLERDSEALLAAAEQDERGPLVELPGDLGHEPRLAHPGLARQEAGPTGTRLRLLPGDEKRSPLVGPADEGHLVGTPEGRRQRGGGSGRFPQDLERRQRLGQSLQVECTDRLEAGADATARQGPHRVVAEDLVPVGGIAEAGSLDDGHAVHVVSVDVHIADREADADVEPGRAHPAALDVDRPLHAQRHLRSRRSRSRRWP